MNELARHIESLLVTNDCVIVPGLGGFVTQHVSAHRIEDENLFLPPYRSVGFNAQLTMNDGLLAQSFMQSRDATYPETVRYIEDLVMDVKRQLREDGEYELEGIGRLSLKLDGSYDFVACESGVLSPEHYGLGSFVAEALDRKEGKRVAATAKNRFRWHRKQEGGRKKDYVVRVDRNVANYSIATLAAALFYLFFSVPMGEQKGSEVTMASLSNGMVWGLPTVAGGQTAEPVKMVKEPVLRTETQAETPSAPKETVAAETDRAAYTIVLASAISEKNARRMVEDVNATEAGKASVYKKGAMVRVVYGAYVSKEEAYEQMNALRQSSGFPDAWVMSLKQ